MRSTFNAASVASSISNNNRCALPLYSEVFAFYWNKDALAKAGYTTPPKTTTELLEYSKKLTTFNKPGKSEISDETAPLGSTFARMASNEDYRTAPVIVPDSDGPTANAPAVPAPPQPAEPQLSESRSAAR